MYFPCPYQAFLSHAVEENDSIAIPLCRVLRGRGISVISSMPQLHSGDVAQDKIERYKKTVLVGIFVLSPEYLAQKWNRKELICFERRFEEAKRKGDLPPVLLPVYYRLTVEECGATGLSKHIGVESSEHVTNAESREMDEKRAKLIEKIADVVEKAVQLVSVQHSETTPRGLASAAFPQVNLYNPRFLIPMPSPYILQDFRARDEYGNFASVEGRLKHALMSTLRQVTVSGPSTAVVGMGATGKTTALVGLGWEDDVRAEFKDGGYLLTLGEKADATHVIREVARMLCRCGGESLAMQVREAVSIKSAVDIAATWFKEKKFLLLLDDVWESDPNPMGYFEELQRLVSTPGRVVISTRDENIALATGRTIYCSAREPLGSESRQMLFRYSCLESETLSNSGSDDAVEKILHYCAGIPLILGIAGRMISLCQAKNELDWESAMAWCAAKLVDGGDSVLHENLGTYGESLHNVVMKSLEKADRWGQSNEILSRFGQKLLPSDLFCRLSVMRKRARLPMNLLPKLWGLPDMMLVQRVVDKLSKLGLLSGGKSVGVHDVLLDVSVHESTKSGKISSYHSQLLRAYKCPVVDDETFIGRFLQPFTGVLGGIYDLVDCLMSSGGKRSRKSTRMRAWWLEALDKNGYLQGNLARHLVGSQNVQELQALLTDSRWTVYRVKGGSVFAWEDDFAELLSGLNADCAEKMLDDDRDELKKEVEVIRDAAVAAWSFLLRNPAELAFQVFGRLRGLNESTAVVSEYLTSVGKRAEKPWLMPMVPCFSSPVGPLRMEMPVGPDIQGIAICPTKPLAFAAVGSKIVVIDLEKKVIRMKMSGHRDIVTSVAVSENGLYIVSGSNDKTLRWWDVDSGVQIGEALEGHIDCITCVGVSGDGRRAISGSLDGTIRLWDLGTSTQIGEALTGHTGWVLCVAMSLDGKKVVSGAVDRTLRVWGFEGLEVVSQSLEGNTGPVTCLALTMDQKTVICGSDDGSLRIWDLHTLQQVEGFFEGHSNFVRCAVTTKDGRRAITSSDDMTLRIWDLKKMCQVGESITKHIGWVGSVGITPDGKRVVCGSEDGILRMWDIEALRRVSDSPDLHTGSISCLAIAVNAKRVVSGSEDGTIRVWNIGTLRQEGGSFTGIDGRVLCVAISADGKRAACGSEYGIIQVWDLDRHTLVGGVLEKHTGEICSVTITTDGKFIVSGCSMGTLRVWRLETLEPVGGAFTFHETSIVECRVSKENVVTSRSRGKVVRSKIDEVTGFIVLFEGDEDRSKTNSAAFDIPPLLICRGREVWMKSGEKKLLGTLPDLESFAFDAKRRLLVTGHRNGVVAFHTLIE